MEMGIFALVILSVGLLCALLAVLWKYLRARQALDMARASELQMAEESARRRSDEDQYRRTQATTAAILDAAVDGVITIDENGIIENFNPAAERIFGYSKADVVGRNVNVLMPEPYHAAHDDYIRAYLRTGEAKIIGIGREVRGQRRDGSIFPMDLAVGESRLGGRRLFAGIVRDITERKRTEERLRSSEERFRLLVENVRDYAITMLDTEGRVTSWNQGGERLFGWRADEIIGKYHGSFFLPEEAAAGQPASVLQAVREHGRHEVEGWRVRKDGSRFWANVILSPLLDDQGHLRGYVRISRDITDRRQYEENLRKAKEEAERANLAKSKFLAAASHDLRQPVQALFFFTSALARKLVGRPEQVILADLERSLDALNLLLDSLLDISRLDAGVVTMQSTDFAVSSLLDRMEAEFQPMARAKGVELKVLHSSVTIRSDPALLSRILHNLAANAVRYTREGRILVGCRRRARSVVIEVWDTGIGIPANRLDDIFQEFYQIGNQERDRTQGLGLGLAIVQRMAKLLGHGVHVRSTPGKGSVFGIEVPLGENAARAPQRVFRPAPKRDADAKRLVVIIDDEATVLRALSLVLEDWGFEVLAADSEEEAVALLHDRQAPNAIVADYRLRDGRTGTEAIRHIRDIFKAPIPSIIITGDTAPERLREAEASGFSILHKPVQPPQLQTLLNVALGVDGRSS